MEDALPEAGAARRRQFRLPAVMGHRGACAGAPENTLASLRRAAEVGAGWVEFDVMLTGDGVPVLFHDDLLKRLAGRPGRMADTPYRDVAELDVGAWFGPRFRGERVPRLGEALALLVELDLHPNIEIKPTPGRDEETARAALEVAHAAWPTDRPPPLVSSFSRRCLAVARTRRPEWPRALIAFEVPKDWRAALDALECDAFHVHHKVLTDRRIAAFKAGGRPLAAFTVNDPRRARELYRRGVDCIISDAPERIPAPPAR